MSFAVVRMAKMKSFDLKGIQFHNQRERESRTNFDIDENRSHENYDLVNDENINYNERVKEIIESQKTDTRKTRKDAVLVNELLVTSDKSFFEQLSESDQRKFFEESLKVFEKRYGKENIAYAVVHVDEKTPHMHVGVVPMRDGKLQGKNVFNRAELIWLQDNFHAEIKKHGFDLERGEKGSTRQHIEAQIYKKSVLEQEIKNLESLRNEKKNIENKLAEKKNELLSFSNDLPPEKDWKIIVLGNEVKTKVIPKLIGHDEVVKKKTSNLVIAPEEFKKVQRAAYVAVQVKSEYERLLKTDLVKQNHQLFNQIDELKYENKKLNKELDNLKEDNRSLRSEIGYLMSEIESIYQATKSFLQSRTNDSERFKELLKGFVSEVKDYFKNGELEKLYKSEQPRQKKRDMER